MIIHDPLTFWGNVTGLVAVFAKTIFDLFINPYFFHKDEQRLGLIKAAERKRSWADLSVAWTFFLVGVGFALSIAALVSF